MEDRKHKGSKLQKEADRLFNRLIAHSNRLFRIGLPTKRIERIIVRASRRKERRQRGAILPTYSQRLAFVEQLAQLLGETERQPIMQIRRIVERCGIECSAVWLAQTKQIEENGGEMLPDGSRQRTPGGVFFRVVRDAVSPEDRKKIFPYTGKNAGKGSGKPVTPDAPSLPSATWADREATITEALQQTGKVTTVKITIIGKVGKAVERQGFALVTLQHDGKLPALPKGIPTPAQPLPTSYILHIGSKQWNKVKESLRNPEDVLIAEGVPLLDPRYTAITVFVTNANTKLLQAALREQQKAAG